MSEKYFQCLQCFSKQN